MANYSLVIGVYPTTPTTAKNFRTNYLDGLSIKAYAVTFTDPDPAAPTSTVIGTAVHKTGPNNRIYQLLESGKKQAAAAAVIKIPAGIVSQFVEPAADPYVTSADPLLNVVLEVSRNGEPLFNDSVNYDVGVWTGTGALKSLAGVTVGLYLGLTAEGTVAVGSPYLALPADGSPPSYKDLSTAIERVVEADPGAGAGYDPENLTEAECMHIAREIIGNRIVNPLPTPLPKGGPPPDLGALFTATNNNAEPEPAARGQFLGSLEGYYARLTGEATKLAGYIYAWSAAQQCATKVQGAPEVGFTFPLRLASAAGNGQVAEATVALHN
jgi:hypothetical protein